MPDASLFDDMAALDRVFELRRRAAEHRKIAVLVQSRNGWSTTSWLFSACKFDSQADIILEAMKQGKTVPKVDFGNESFRG